MPDITGIIAAQAKIRPLSEPQDFIKLIYQHSFGPDHMTEHGNILEKLKSDIIEAGNIHSCGKTDEYEDIGSGFVRINLGCFKGRAETLAGALAASSPRCDTPDESRRRFIECIGVFYKMAENGAFAFTSDAVTAFMKNYPLSGKNAFPPLMHSERYCAAYSPSYRVVSAVYRNFRALFDMTDAKLNKNSRTAVVFDGRSGSGKTYISRFFSDVYGCDVCRTDDFFLPAGRKTQGRLSEPGGNFDRERFESEIIRPLLSGKEFCYRPYSCRTGKFCEKISINPSPLAAVEGVYSMHPAFGNYADISVFMTVDPDEQSRRILNRNGIEMHRRFIEEWIPLEEKYFSAFGIREKCSFVFENIF